MPSVYEIRCAIWQRSPGCFHQSDKDRSVDTGHLTSYLLSNSLSFTLNPDSTSKPPAKLLKDYTNLGWCCVSGYGTGVLMEVGRGVEDRILKHLPLSWGGRERSYWLMLLGVKEERSKCYLELCKITPAMCLDHAHAPRSQTYHWALDPQSRMRGLAIIQRRALNRRLS